MSGVSQRTGNAWSAQEYVIETHDQYPKKCCFKVFGDEKISQFNIQLGEELTVSFDIDAREYQGRWFNSVDAWKVERGAYQQPAQQPQQAAPQSHPTDNFPPPTDANDNPADGTNDLPF